MPRRRQVEELKAHTLLTPNIRLLRPLGEGGMGSVWVAQHLALNAEVVVKLMGRHIADRPDAAARFAREASSAAAIRSPHVVQVFDYGVTEGGTPYIVMELLDGKDLGAWLAVHRKMEPRAVVTLVMQMAKALTKAHKAGVIHRDIKPENIFLCETEDGELFVKLLDFGTAKALDAQTETPLAIPDGEEPARPATNPGELLGTPWYMSPEQIVRAAEVDARADVWSLGVVVFELLTGYKPFDGATVGAIALAIHTTSPRMTELAPDLPPAVDAWFAHACAREPNERFPSAREAAFAFVEAITGAPPMEESVPLSAVEPKIDAYAPEPFVAEKLAATLPHPKEARRPVMIATTVVIGAALAVMAGVVLRTPDKASEPATQATTHAATTPKPLPPPATTEAKKDEPKKEEPKPEPAATTQIAKVEHPAPPPPPDPRTVRRASGHNAAPTPKKPPPLPAPTAAAIGAAAKPATAPAKPAAGGPDDDLNRLANIPSSAPPPPAPKPEVKPEPAPTPVPPPQLPPE